jgi:transcriptional regulator with XRE-family HTH domain
MGRVQSRGRARGDGSDARSGSAKPINQPNQDAHRGPGIDDIIEQQIARRIRQFRMDRGMTLQQLSAATGFSKGLLSKIENCVVSPPIGTLARIAEAFDVHISDFFGSEESRPDTVFFPRSARRKVHSHGSSLNYQYELLAPGLRRREMQPMLVTIDGSNSRFGLQQHAGEQFIFMIEGSMQYVVGERSYKVDPGDVLYFDARSPHGPKLAPDQRAKYIVVHTDH